MPLLMGVTSGGIVVPVQVDANGKVVISQTIPQGGYGWYSSAWQKSPIPLGISDSLVYSFYDENLAAGYVVTYSTTVPAGELWVVTNMGVTIVSASITVFQVTFVSGANTPILWAQTAPASGTTYDKQGTWVLKPGEKIGIVTQNTTLGNDLYVGFVGYKIDIDQ